MSRLTRLLGLLAAACGTEPACDAATLDEQLSGAGEGDTVYVGDCSVEGSFVVDEGVTLEGTTAASAIVAPGDARPGPLGDPPQIAITVRGGTIRSLTVEARASAAIRAEGDAVVIEDVAVRVPGAGIGIGAQSVGSLTLRRVSVEGSIATQEDARVVPIDARSRAHATFGLAIFDVADAQLEDVEISNMARFGALFFDSATTWQGGGVEGGTNTGIGIYVGTATLRDVRACGQLAAGFARPSYGMVIVGAEVLTERLEICDVDGVGIMDGEASSDHVDISVHDNTDIGIWSQGAEHFAVRGTGSDIRNNRFAGLAFLLPHDVTIADATIADTILGESGVDTGFGSVPTGEGIHMITDDTLVNVAMTSLTVSSNAQSQILIDLGGVSANANFVTFEDVTVSGEDAQLGMIAQGAAVPEGFDSGVTRTGATIDNDAVFASQLETLAPALESEIPLPVENLDGAIMPID